jgi:hypothetical protein
MKIHPVAELFPLMSPDEFQTFKADIAANGQHDEIWIYQGAIIDGRNRYRACQELGIEPRMCEWDGQGSLVGFVVSLNLHRRHLTSSQRAAVAVNMLPMLEEEAQKRMREGGETAGRGRPKTVTTRIVDKVVTTQGTEVLEVKEDEEPEPKSDQPSQSLPKAPQLFGEPIGDMKKNHDGEAAQDAAKLVNTNRQYITDAKYISDAAPDIFEKVKAGELTIPQAKQEVKRQERQTAAETAEDTWPADELRRRDAALAGEIVIAHLEKDKRLIGWAEKEGRLVRIDRATDWGNPYVLGSDGDRPTVIKSFEIYFARKFSLHPQCANLKGKVLACWCYPEACHGQAIARWATNQGL